MTGIFRQEELWLQDQFIFLSASKPTRNTHIYNLMPERPEGTSLEIEEAVVSLARAVFFRGGRLVFGGHPSISPLVASVASEYFPARQIEKGREPVWIFQSKAFAGYIPDTTMQMRELGLAEIFWTDEIDGEQYNPGIRDREQCLKSLRRMREAMIDLEPAKESMKRKPIAMVAIGGMEGVVREARLFLERTENTNQFPKPRVYTLKSTAGAAAKLSGQLDQMFPDESGPIVLPGWRERITVLEEKFPIPQSAGRVQEGNRLPLKPYAVLMQLLVMEIANKNRRPPVGR